MTDTYQYVKDNNEKTLKQMGSGWLEDHLLGLCYATVSYYYKLYGIGRIHRIPKEIKMTM